MDGVSTLKSSVEKLLEQINRLKDENRLLKAHTVSAEARAATAEQRVEQLQQQLTSTLLKSTITEVAGGAKAAKLRIARLIRDIDKCIAMSSK